MNRIILFLFLVATTLSSSRGEFSSDKEESLSSYEDNSSSLDEVGDDVEMERPVRIVNGSPVPISVAPYQVSLQVRSSYGGFTHTCGGSLIRSRWVLTAGHCVKRRANGVDPAYFVVVGTDRLKKRPYGRNRVIQIIRHKYNHKTKVNDLALLKLHRDVISERNEEDPVAVIPLPRIEEVANGTCYATGYGRVHSGGKVPPGLQMVDVDIMLHKRCERIFHKQIIVTNKMICAGGGRKDACQGDSGGPLVCEGSDGNKILSGIVSWGVGCATKGVPGVYTDVRSYTSWIDGKINKNEEES